MDVTVMELCLSEAARGAAEAGVAVDAAVVELLLRAASPERR